MPMIESSAWLTGDACPAVLPPAPVPRPCTWWMRMESYFFRRFDHLGHHLRQCLHLRQFQPHGHGVIGQRVIGFGHGELTCGTGQQFVLVGRGAHLHGLGLGLHGAQLGGGAIGRSGQFGLRGQCGPV